MLVEMLKIMNDPLVTSYSSRTTLVFLTFESILGHLEVYT